MRVVCQGADLPAKQVRALCQNMLQSLAQIAPRATLRQVQSGDWLPQRPGDVSVRLQLEDERGRLSWQVGPNGPARSGPALPFTDASPQQFTRTLTTETHTMLADMAAAFAISEE